MAAGLNVVPLRSISNSYAQALSQQLQSLQTARTGFYLSVQVIVRAVEAQGGSVGDLATIFGVSSGQAQVLYNEATAFKGQLDTIAPGWDQFNAITGTTL